MNADKVVRVIKGYYSQLNRMERHISTICAKRRNYNSVLQEDKQRRSEDEQDVENYKDYI